MTSKFSLLILGFASAPLSLFAEPSKWEKIKPILAENCYSCHRTNKMKGGVDLKRLENDPSIEAEYALWEKVHEVISNGQMPPEDETPLVDSEKKETLDWLHHSMDAVALANAGDPGPVTMRRLTNVEYDCAIRDLTGTDFNLAKEFSPDGGGGEGFANTGDVLFISPQQIDKYLTAARKLVDNTTILPGTGIVFHPQRIGLRGAEQFKAQAEQALYVWYQQKAAAYLPKDEDSLREADYMLACWKFKHKEQTGVSSLAQLAAEMKLQPAFLDNWWKILNSVEPKSRFLDLTRLPWQELPSPDVANPKAIPAGVTLALNVIQDQRVAWYDTKTRGKGSSVQRMQQDSDGLKNYGISLTVDGQKLVNVCVGDLGDGSKGDIVLVSDISIKMAKGWLKYYDWLKGQIEADQKELAQTLSFGPSLQTSAIKKRLDEKKAVLVKFGKHPQGRPVDEKTLVLAAPIVATFPLPPEAKLFNASCRLDMENPEVDFATMQWKATTGKPYDVTKIIPGSLVVWKRQTPAHGAVMGDFTRMKMAFPDTYDRRLEEVARNYLRRGTGIGIYYFSDDQLSALLSPKEQQHLKNMRTDWSFVSAGKLSPKQAEEWDVLVKQQLFNFTSKAWRRPLDDHEKTGLAALYQEGVAKELDRESAAREVLVRVLVSPNFIYKTEIGTFAQTPENVPATDQKIVDVPLNSWELASRLSFFLWSSIPDESLRQAAANGSLLKPDVLREQTLRMLKDRKTETMAKQFTGQWLEFDGFATHTGVDASKFPEFTPELRRDMTKETVSFFTYLIREDRPVREIVQADYSFINERLAKFYGVPNVTGSEFKKVSVSAQQRGGLLGMGSILTKTSRPHRTSPVVRGNWLLAAVLGMPTPPPPSDVPELEEAADKPESMRARLELHRAHIACSSCHDRIDPLGFVLESFDGIGRLRTVDEFGHPIDTSGKLKDGSTMNGVAGLRKYLADHEDQFLTLFCRKMVGYALGRRVLPTDKVLIQKMKSEMQANEGKFSAAVLSVVQSRQFLDRRSD